MGLPAMVRLHLAREDLRELGGPSGCGQHLPGGGADAGGPAPCRALFRRRVLRGAGVPGAAGLDDEMGGAAPRPGAAAPVRAGAAGRDRPAGADRFRAGRLSRAARQPRLERHRHAVLEPRRPRGARPRNPGAGSRRQAEERRLRLFPDTGPARGAAGRAVRAAGRGGRCRRLRLRVPDPRRHAAAPDRGDVRHRPCRRERRTDDRAALRRALRPGAGDRRPPAARPTAC